MDSPRAGPPAGGDMGPIAAQREQSDRRAVERSR